MVQKLRVQDVSREVSDFLRKLAANGGDYLVVDELDNPIVGVVPPWGVEAPERNRLELLRMIEGIRERNKDVDPEETEQDVAEAIREVRSNRLSEQDRI